MSDLEKYIIEMRDRMDMDEPSKEHFKRFKRKMGEADGSSSGNQPPIRRINFRHALQIAASIAIILTSGILIVRSSKGSSKVAAAPEVQEFRQTQNYYATQVNQRYDDIATIRFDSEEEKQMLLQELSEMDSYYKELINEFDANPGDERVMNALIQHYQMKLDVMDQILGQLQEFKNSNYTEQDEKTSI